MTSTQLDERVEDLIDAAGLQSVIESIDRICFAKSEHIRGQWQDHELADGWFKASLLLEKVLRSFPL